MEVDVYGPVDILCYIKDEDLMWHGVLPISSQSFMKSSSYSRLDDGSGSILESIRGTTLNQFLLIFFNVCGQEYRLKHLDDLEWAQKMQMRGDHLEFPVGDRQLWLSSVHDVYTFCSIMCPIRYILVRVERLMNIFISGENDSTIFIDTVYGSIEFLLNWTKGYSRFLDLKQLLEIRRFVTFVLKLLRDSGDKQLIPRLQVLGEQIEKECSKTTVQGPDNRYVPTLPTNNSINVMAEQEKKRRWKEEQDELKRQKEAEGIAAAQALTEAKNNNLRDVPPEGFEKGQQVMYDNSENCIIVGKHMDDYPNIYYTIQLPDGREKQTVAEKLEAIKLSEPESKKGSTINADNDDPNYVPAIFGLKLGGDDDTEDSDHVDNADGDSASDFSRGSMDEMKKGAEETAARYRKDLEDEENRRREQEETVLLMETETDPTLKKNLSYDTPGNAVPYALSFLPRTFEFHGNPKRLHDELFAMNIYEIARQWTLVDQKLFASIPLPSFMRKKWSDPRYMNESASIRKFIDRFNATSLWTTTSILNANVHTTNKIAIAEHCDENIPENGLFESDFSNADGDIAGTPEDRARMYMWFIELAACFDGLNNFSGMIAILSGLQQPSVTRLKSTLQLVSDKAKNTFQKLQSLSAVNKNYSAYRSELGRRIESLQDDETDSLEYEQKKSQVDFAETTAGNVFSSWGIEFSIKHPLARGTTGIVPHLGPHLHEIVAIDEGNSDRVPDFPNLINLKKKMLLAKTVSTLKELQQLSYHSSMLKVEEDGRTFGNGKKFIRPIRRIISMLGIHLQRWVDLKSSSNIKRNETDKQLYALSQSLEASNDSYSSQSHYDGIDSKEGQHKYESTGNSPSPSSQNQQRHLNSNGQSYTPAKSSDGIRRYNDKGEESDSVISSDYGTSPAAKGGMFSYLFRNNR